MRCYDLHDYFLQHRSKLKSVDFLTKFLSPYCDMGWKDPPPKLQLWQIPREFARFLIFMAEHEVNSYIEIGVAHGGTLFTTDSYLRATNPGFRRSVGYDRKARLIDYMKYKARFSGCEFRQSDSRTIQLNENFDLAFVDARHSMKLVRNDFNKVKDHSKYVAFHDIINPYASVTEVWEPLKKQYKHWEIIDSNESYSCGIGVIKL